MKATEIIRARVPVELKHNFETIAQHQGMSVSHILRRLMEQYIEREKELAQRREETLEALEDIETDRVVDGDEILTWLASWGTEDELEPPT